MAVLTEQLEHVASDCITICHDPGAPALERLGAIADGIGRELAQQRTVAAPDRATGHSKIDS